MRRKRAFTEAETAEARREATTDPLCACRVLDNGQVVPTQAAIAAADEAATEARKWREYLERKRNGGSPSDEDVVDTEQAEGGDRADSDQGPADDE